MNQRSFSQYGLSDKVAKALLEKETLDTDEFEKIAGKKKSSEPRATTSPIMA